MAFVSVGLVVHRAEEPLAQHPGQAKFAMYCSACHRAEPAKEMVAPPVFAVADHYKIRFGKNREAFVAAVVDWAKRPSEDATLMPGAVRRFKLMPPMPLPDVELKAIADFLYTHEFPQPQGYRKHYRAEHGG